MQNLDEVEAAKALGRTTPAPWEGLGPWQGRGSWQWGLRANQGFKTPPGSLGTGLCFHNCFENLLKAKTPLPRKIYSHI